MAKIDKGATQAAGDGIRPTALIAFAVIVLIGIELGCQLAFRLKEHRWIVAADPMAGQPLYTWHPYLVATPTPNVDRQVGWTRIRHNSMGFRGPEFDLKKKPGVRRIVTMGASTTYCTGVSEGQTWPELLQQELGSGYEVINLGVPGYGTIENLIQTALLISDLSPDITTYYEGWSDIRSMHIKNLKPDYSNYHPQALYQALAVEPPAPTGAVASLYYLRKFLGRSPVTDSRGIIHAEGDADQLTDKIDPRARNLYMRNLRSIIAVNRSMGIEPILIPQLLNYERLTADSTYGWIPYIRDKDLKSGMAAYNEGMRTVAAEQHVGFVGEVLQAPFGNDDFWDNGHFNEQGTLKFAEILARYIRAHDHPRKTHG